jgi:hypothetical protein
MSFSVVAFWVHNVGTEIDIFGFSFYVSSDAYFILPMILLASTLFILHAIAVFQADKSTLNFSIAYEKNHIEKFTSSRLAIFTLLQFARDKNVSKLRLLRGDTRAAVRVLRVSAKALTPFTTLIVSGIYLCYVQPILSILIFVFSIGYFSSQKKIATSGAIANKNLEILSPKFSSYLNKIIEKNLEPPHQLNQIERKSKVSDEMEKLYYDNFIARIYAQ